MAIRIDWAKGGYAEAVSLEGENVVVNSSIASPPGSRIAGLARVGADEEVVEVRVKVHGCTREGEHFSIRGRLLDLSRNARERLASEMPSIGTEDDRSGHKKE